jgi:hypothetical protein
MENLYCPNCGCNIANHVTKQEFIKIIEHACQGGCANKDMLIGALEYKLAYTVEKLKQLRDRIEDPSIKGSIEIILINMDPACAGDLFPPKESDGFPTYPA